MSEAKTYKKQEVSEDYVAEPMAMEYSTVAEDAAEDPKKEDQKG